MGDAARGTAGPSGMQVCPHWETPSCSYAAPKAGGEPPHNDCEPLQLCIRELTNSWSHLSPVFLKGGHRHLRLSLGGTSWLTKSRGLWNWLCHT